MILLSPPGSSYLARATLLGDFLAILPHSRSWAAPAKHIHLIFVHRIMSNISLFFNIIISSLTNCQPWAAVNLVDVPMQLCSTGKNSYMYVKGDVFVLQNTHICAKLVEIRRNLEDDLGRVGGQGGWRGLVITYGSLRQVKKKKIIKEKQHILRVSSP